MKRALKTILHSTLLFGGTALAAVSGSLPIIIGMIPVAAISAGKLADDLDGNEINNSIFSVSKKGNITQNSLAKPLRTLRLLGKKDKTNAFKEESINMFTKLKQKDKDGNDIIYNTVSHALTISLLKQMKENGYVKEITYEKKKKSNLFLAKMFIGNSKGLFGKKKVQMYDINFTLTDKERKKEELIRLMNVPTEKKEEIITQEPVIEQNKNKENTEIREKIRNLENQKEELINSQYENKEQKRHHM